MRWWWLFQVLVKPSDDDRKTSKDNTNMLYVFLHCPLIPDYRRLIGHYPLLLMLWKLKDNVTLEFHWMHVCCRTALVWFCPVVLKPPPATFWVRHAGQLELWDQGVPMIITESNTRLQLYLFVINTTTRTLYVYCILYIWYLPQKRHEWL